MAYVSMSDNLSPYPLDSEQPDLPAIKCTFEGAKYGIFNAFGLPFGIFPENSEQPVKPGERELIGRALVDLDL